MKKGRLMQLELDRISAIQPSMDNISLSLKLAFKGCIFSVGRRRILLLENIRDMEDF